VRAPEARPNFVPGNEPGAERWFVRDLGEMVRARGLERAAPFYVDADGAPNPGGWPRGGQTRLSLPNNHLGYAITWFGIAATLVGVLRCLRVGA
jgi:surfeit locus 1 family protein